MAAGTGKMGLCQNNRIEAVKKRLANLFNQASNRFLIGQKKEHGGKICLIGSANWTKEEAQPGKLSN